MIERIGLVVSVCLTALLISSCGGGGSSSGVDQSTDELDAIAAAYARPGEEGAEVSSSSSSSSLTTPSTTTTTATASSTNDSTYEGYVNKYADLLRVYNASGGGQTKSAWGKTHYCNSGRNEGRTVPGDYSGSFAGGCSTTATSSSSSTSSTSSSQMNLNDHLAYEGYVNKYADLLRVYNASGGGQTKSAWGKTHYCNSGRNEGRTYSGLSAASCSSTTTSSSSSTSSTTSSAYEGYVNKYADLLRVYNASGGGQTKSAWGKTHYCNSGRNEGRTYSGLSAASCSSTTTSSSSSTSSTTSSAATTSAATTSTVSLQRINGTFTGWDGESIYGLTKGQYWKQSTYYYCYDYKYRPEVSLYYSAGWKMKVVGSTCNAVGVKLLSNVYSSRINGTFNGWDGNSMYTLTNGQTWQQASWYWYWSWKYRPEVLVYFDSGWKMKVDDLKAVSVRRIYGW